MLYENCDEDASYMMPLMDQIWDPGQAPCCPMSMILASRDSWTYKIDPDIDLMKPHYTSTNGLLPACLSQYDCSDRRSQKFPGVEM